MKVVLWRPKLLILRNKLFRKMMRLRNEVFAAQGRSAHAGFTTTATIENGTLRPRLRSQKQ
jgi:hypothetical protein